MKRVAAIAAVLLLAPVPALADGGAFRDGDEQPFCEDPDDDCPDNDYMDFRRATFGHGDGDVVRHGVQTRKRWKTKELGGRHGVTLFFDFDVDDDPAIERRVKVRRKHGELWAQMHRGRYLRKKMDGNVRAWRPGRRSVKIRFATRMLGDVESYRWHVWWANRQIACSGSCHNDMAPNRGSYEHRL